MQPAFCWFLAWLTLRPWWWRRYVPPKHRWTSIELSGVTTQKIDLQSQLWEPQIKRAHIIYSPPHPIVNSHTMCTLHTACFQKELYCTLEDTTAESVEHVDEITHLPRPSVRLDIYICCKYEMNTLSEMPSISRASTYGAAAVLNRQRVTISSFSLLTLLTAKPRTLRAKIEKTITCSAWLYFTAMNNGRGEGEVPLCLNTKPWRRMGTWRQRFAHNAVQN
jgi:hypothetical protein